MKDFFIEQRPSAEEIEKFVVTPERWRAALEYYREHREDLIRAAAYSRDNAVSHRDPPFKVGCAALGIEPILGEDEYSVYQAYNFKPSSGKVEGTDKRCAERNALDAARAWARVIVALATISKEKSTGDPTKAHDALHPCRDCRDMLRKLLTEGFLRNDSVICNANDAQSASGNDFQIEERTLEELLALYNDDLTT